MSIQNVINSTNKGGVDEKSFYEKILEVDKKFHSNRFFVGISFGIYEYYAVPQEEHKKEEALYMVKPRDSIEKNREEVQDFAMAVENGEWNDG